MMRDVHLIRAFQFLRLMDRHVRPTADEIARELGVSLRQAKRYIAAARTAHVPMPPTVNDVGGF